MDSEERKRKYLGYQKYGKVNERSLNLIVPELCRNLSNISIEKELSGIEPASLDYIKEQARKFYGKYFDLHDVDYINLENIQKNISDIGTNVKDELSAYRMYYSLFNKVSPFDLPIELDDYNHSMEGKLVKPVVLFGYEISDDIIEKRVPMSKIVLSSHIDLLSAATYSHEIAHTQQESNIGYASDFSNREVISIFIEKLAALELDPTGNLLKKQERARFAHMYDKIRIIASAKVFSNMPMETLLEAHQQVQSALFAEKLFDNYINERKPKNRDRYISGIQDVFDGKCTVEDMLGSRGININNSATVQLVKKHLS